MAMGRAMKKKLNEIDLAAAFKLLVAGDLTLTERTVKWQERESFRLPKSAWGNSTSSKFGERIVTRERLGYFLGDEEVEPDVHRRLSQLAKAYAEAPDLVARLRVLEATPGWEWIDRVQPDMDELVELVPHAREALEEAVSELSLGLVGAVRTAQWRLRQAEPHLEALAVAKEREAAGYTPYFGG